MLFITYIILVSVITFLSIKCAYYVNMLESKTNLSGAFLGGVVLAAVTALPELVTSVSSITLIDSPCLLLGGILGSNIFNLSVLAILILSFFKRFQKCKLESIHNKTLYMLILIYIILFIKMQFKFGTTIFNVDIMSTLILSIYLISLKILYSDNSNSSSDENLPKSNISNNTSSLRSILAKFTLASMGLIIFSISLTLLTDKISATTGMGSTLSGALFLGITTSIPEVATCVTLCKLGNFNSSFGNIIGSTIFNCNIVAICDFIYNKGSIYMVDAESYKLVIFGLVSTILTMMILKSKLRNHKNSGPIYLIISLLILISYLFFVFL